MNILFCKLIFRKLISVVDNLTIFKAFDNE